MGGVFMFKLLRLVVLGVMLYGAFTLGGIVRDQQVLSEDVIRLHVVANSDSAEDQALKLLVKDAVVEKLEEMMGSVQNAEEAKAFLSENLNQIREIAEQQIRQVGLSDEVTVALTQEIFDTRTYETFSLPAGVYESLRIVIGNGAGENWWCVVFPSLCMPQESLEVEAAGAGFSDTLTDTLQQEDGYEIRFWFLDMFGRIRSLFW